MDAAKRILLRLAGEGGAAPAIWPMEIANSLELSMRKERISPLQSDDAQYLETALRLRLPLATFDGELIAAARAEGVVVLP